MDSLTVIENKISEAKKKRREIIIEAMDGRTQRAISEKTGIHETKLSKWINGFGELEPNEMDKLSSYLGVNFK